MKTNEQNTEQVILEAAEAEFLEERLRRSEDALYRPEGRSGAFDVALLL